MYTNSYVAFFFMNQNFDRSKIFRVIKFAKLPPYWQVFLLLAMSVMFYVSNFNPSLFIVSNQKYNISKDLSYPKYMYHMLNATVYNYTESFYCIHLYIIVKFISLLEEPNDKA